MLGNIQSLLLANVLLESSYLIGWIVGFLLLIFFVYVPLSHIYNIDQIEYKHKVKREYLTFKRSIFLIIHASPDKRVVAKKTFIWEAVSYAFVVVLIAIGIASLFLEIVTAMIVLGVSIALMFIYSSVTAILLAKARKQYGHENDWV